jgi:hypothetical protein
MQNNKRILIVAFLFHLPGLRLFYNIKFTDYPKFQNILASALTLLGCLLSYYLFKSTISVLFVYALCHMLWGLYLVSYLRSVKTCVLK